MITIFVLKNKIIMMLKAVAKHLGIEIRRVDFIKEYWDKVFTYFY